MIYDKLSALCIFFILFFLPLNVFSAVPGCYKDLEINFFRPNLLNEALSLHAISQSNWVLINQELQKNLRRVPRMIKVRAEQMDLHPFKQSPFNAQEASKLLRDVLLQVFKETLALFQITNLEKIEEMFEYIRERQTQRLVACFGDKELLYN